MNELLFYYVLPLVICIISHWVTQFIDPEEKVFAVCAFVPLLNWFGVIVSVIISVGCIGIFLLELPSIIRNLFKD